MRCRRLGGSDYGELVLAIGVVSVSVVSALFFFFFSSRRRHTRLQGDWSSDVCSSDLCVAVDVHLRPPRRRCARYRWGHGRPRGPCRITENGNGCFPPDQRWIPVGRSEERRVGKECRSRWSPDHLKKKKKKDEASSQII